MSLYDQETSQKQVKPFFRVQSGAHFLPTFDPSKNAPFLTAPGPLALRRLVFGPHKPAPSGKKTQQDTLRKTESTNAKKAQGNVMHAVFSAGKTDRNSFMPLWRFPDSWILGFGGSKTLGKATCATCLHSKHPLQVCPQKLMSSIQGTASIQKPAMRVAAWKRQRLKTSTQLQCLRFFAKMFGPTVLKKNKKQLKKHVCSTHF